MRHWTIVLTAWFLLTVLAAPTLLAGPKRGKAHELRHLDERVRQLETEKTELKNRLDMRERQLTHYRSSLERALVANRQLRQRHLPPDPALLPRRAAPFEIAERQLLSQAKVHVQAGRATVSGMLVNPSKSSRAGTLVVELLRDSIRIDEARLPDELPPLARIPYSVTFKLEGYGVGVYAARARFVFK